MNRKEFTALDCTGQNADKDNNDLGLSLLAAKTFDEFEERLDWLQRFQRQLELSQTGEEVHHNTQSAITPARSQGKYYPRVIFK